MKKNANIKTIGLFCAIVLITLASYAGNSDRTGQAGAAELLINPWARSTGLAGANSSNVKGLEATYLNVAGIAFTKRTELIFSHNNWLGSAAGIKINSFGFTQRVGETGGLALSVMSMSFGDIPITTYDQPEPNLGTFSPSFVNMGLSYAKGFSDNIYGGMTVRIISESISNVATRGVALDAGIQYVTGPLDNIHFGIALKNVGPRMRYAGDGLSFRAPIPLNNPSGTKTYTVENRTANFELPSLINIGVAYDFYFSKDSMTMKNNRITASGNFTSNSFSKDQFMFGLEYGYKSFLMLRVGYMYEKGITNNADRTNFFTGPTAGATFEIPLNKSKSTFGLDYSYRVTDPFAGVHSIGARINL